jgi:hypothetical protein
MPLFLTYYALLLCVLEENKCQKIFLMKLRNFFKSWEKMAQVAKIHPI